MLFFCFARLVFAQTQVGVSGGGGLDDFISLRAALPLEFTFSKTFGIRTGVAYTQHHNPEILFLLPPGRDYRRASLSYLGVPVLAKFRFAITDGIHIYGLGGPQVNYALRFTASYIEDEIFGIEVLNFKQLKLRRLDIGLNAGIGVEKNIRNNGKIYAEIIYLLGFSDIDRSSTNEIFNEGRVFTLGFMLPLSKK